ncbi:MAG: hypothetical protein GY832_11180 [Chloroflexi bacterium]|nr:hypothetical protein [Chloroflexota bacterium]
MSKITTISTMVPQTKKLLQADPDGSVWVRIRPPDFYAESERAQVSERITRSYDSVTRMPTITENYNSVELAMLEIWLTYEETNLVVKLVKGFDAEGNPTETELIKFETRDKETRADFLTKLGKLPPQIVNEWHAHVRVVVPAWSPFGIAPSDTSE